MDIFQAIRTRRSIRKYTNEPVSQADIETLLQAAMQAPTATNAQTWRFVVITDRNLLDTISVKHPYGKAAANAPAAILVCGDSTAGKSPEFWPQDASAAMQTLLLAARALNLGSLWIGIHPNVEREDIFIQLCGLPGNIRPLGLALIGHPDQAFSEENRYDPTKVHYNHW